MIKAIGFICGCIILVGCAELVLVAHTIVTLSEFHKKITKPSPTPEVK